MCPSVRAIAFSHCVLTLYANMHTKTTTLHTHIHSFPALPVKHSGSRTLGQRCDQAYNVFLTRHIKDRNPSIHISEPANSQLISERLQERYGFLSGLALLIPDQVFISNRQGYTGKCGIEVSHVREIVFIANTRARENVNPFG